MSNETNTAAQTPSNPPPKIGRPCEHCGEPATHIVCWNAMAIHSYKDYEVIHGISNWAVEKTELCEGCSELVANDRLAYDEIGEEDDEDCETP